MNNASTTTGGPRKGAAKSSVRSAGKGDVELGHRIRLRRVEQGMSQDSLAQALGVSFQQVQKYEKGVNRVGTVRLEQIAKALNVPITFFFNIDKKTKELETLLFVDSAFSMRLLRAYNAMDQAVARHFVSLMERVAGVE